MDFTIKRDFDYLEHHGIKGQKWGVRRYQNEDGTLTEEGKKRYGSESDGEKKKGLSDGAKTALKVGAAAAATALAVYGVRKLDDKLIKDISDQYFERATQESMDARRENREAIQYFNNSTKALYEGHQGKSNELTRFGEAAGRRADFRYANAALFRELGRKSDYPIQEKMDMLFDEILDSIKDLSYKLL